LLGGVGQFSGAVAVAVLRVRCSLLVADAKAGDELETFE
jgi:hypothetical protein